MTKQEFIKSIDGKAVSASPSVSRFWVLMNVARWAKANKRTICYRMGSKAIIDIKGSNQYVMLPAKERTGTVEVHSSFIRAAGVRVDNTRIKKWDASGFETETMRYKFL